MKSSPMLNLASRTITTDRPAFIMGIVNATPDSFFAGSRGNAEYALKLIDEGADIIDPAAGPWRSCGRTGCGR